MIRAHLTIGLLTLLAAGALLSAAPSHAESGDEAEAAETRQSDSGGWVPEPGVGRRLETLPEATGSRYGSGSAGERPPEKAIGEAGARALKQLGEEGNKAAKAIARTAPAGGPGDGMGKGGRNGRFDIVGGAGHPILDDPHNSPLAQIAEIAKTIAGLNGFYGIGPLLPLIILAIIVFGIRARRARGVSAVLLALLAGVGVGTGSDHAQAATEPMEIAVADPRFASEDVETRAQSLSKANRVGAEWVRIPVDWRDIAPHENVEAFDPDDPFEYLYDWERLDHAIVHADAVGLKVYVTISSAPPWAEGPDRPASAAPGTWKPDPEALEQFAIALGRRYSGRFPNPDDSRDRLPKIHYFEVWDRPNSSAHLAPQWEDGRLASAGIYRELVTAVYAGVKRFQPEAQVIAGSTTAYGQPVGGKVSYPVVFLKRLLCLKGGIGNGPQPDTETACWDPARFNVFSHRPLSAAPPGKASPHLGNAPLANLDRLTGLLQRAKLFQTSRPRGAKPTWLTDLHRLASPVDTDAVTPARQAKWLTEALWEASEMGVELVTWSPLLAANESAEGSGGRSGGPGLFESDGRARPAARALRFPFLTFREDEDEGIRPVERPVAAWGIAPRSGRVVIEARVDGRWRPVRRLYTRGAPYPFQVQFTNLRKLGLAVQEGGSRRRAGPSMTRIRAVMPLGTGPGLTIQTREASLAWRQR